ncbi:unknown [Gryllus bimaculatus nudivirus]|uniref:Uncharacterized protein n=1 Tax=Gryllus bimaculatus nudivirus TaxID=432587 RepID=A4L1Z4_9VIRU|nr:hypothetical protein GrBNV_gp31 [Gryllus bimaculatus nudivirus]ABO45364.1 unknown [Gryllus bimaculatus nudivirus]
MTRHENANVNLTKKCDSRKKNLKDQSSVSNKKKHRHQHRRHHHKHKINNNGQMLCDKKVSQDVNKDTNGASTLLKKTEDEEDQQRQLLPIQINLVLHYHQYLITPIIYKKVKTLFLEKYILEQELEKNKIV